MRYPDFIAEMALPQNREKLLYGVRSGYGVTALFALLAIAGPALELVPFRAEFYYLLVIKLVTNTIAWLTAKTGRGLVELSGVNVLADIVCMTGAIHFTGGILSPLVPIYAIEITVIALLTNFGLTVLVAALLLASFSVSVLGVHFGVFSPVPPPRAIAQGVDTAYLVTALMFVAFVVIAPTFYVTNIVRELRDKERALEIRNAELVEAGREKSQFLANVTHELRTPIHGICGLSDLVETGVYGAVTERQKEAHSEIKRSARSLLALIDDLLELVRADAGKTELRPTEVDLDELLPSVLATMRWVKGTRPLELVLEPLPELPRIVTDRAKLAQILVNLLANAVKFTPDGGSVTLAASRAGERVEISIRDTGKGIPESELASIFEAFRQLDGSAEREYGGVGLGLAVVKRLARLLGAEVHVESEVGVGTTFRVVFPLEASSVHRAA